MRLLIDSFWRALAYCLYPRVIALSILPLVLMVGGVFALAYGFWDAAVGAVTAWLQTWELVNLLLIWLEGAGLGALRSVFAPLIVLVVATPVIVVSSLLFVALFMTPAMVDLVARRRFASLERKKGGSWWFSLAWSLGSTVLALLALLISMPFWLIPPLLMVLPPLIWGWLSYRVFAFDTLVEHASAQERTDLMHQYRYQLLGMGVLTGYLGAAPSLLWASGAMFIAMAPLLVPLAIWIYTLVFVFASLWFAHFLLAALAEMRQTPTSSSASSNPFASFSVNPAFTTSDRVVDVSAKEIP
jgi:Etoposide-induced protein 2.4 (EI24)